MADELLKGCKKYSVERVLSPSLYLMTQYERGRTYKREKERLECLLEKNVEKVSETREVSVGEIVAIKGERRFHRALVKDIFKRCSNTACWLLLMDYGKYIEVKHRNIYVIQNEELKKRKLNVVEVCLHGIQPAAVSLEYKNYVGGIFQKKVSHSWSPIAVDFVKNIIKMNPHVFVKIVKEKGVKYGEIFYTEETSKVPVSLGQKLCAEGFAVPFNLSPQLNIVNNVKGGSQSDQKAPNSVSFSEMENNSTPGNLKLEKKESNNIKILNASFSYSTLPEQHVLKSKSSSSSDDINSHGERLKIYPNKSINSNSCSFQLCTSSWILKNYKNITPCYLSKKVENPIESKQSDSSEIFRGNIFKYLQRSVEFYNKEKENERMKQSK